MSIRFNDDTPEFRAWILTRFHKPSGEAGCWLWMGAHHAGGYGCVRFGGKNAVRVHRLMYELFCGPIGDGLLVCHSCDTPLCANPNHLFVGTMKQNMEDAKAKGRCNYVIHHGEDAGSSKLRETQVREIKTSRQPTRFLAASYGVSRSTIQRIRSGARWSHIDGGVR